MELVIEVGLLCGVSFGITYERLQKHTLFIDFFFKNSMIVAVKVPGTDPNVIPSLTDGFVLRSCDGGPSYPRDHHDSSRAEAYGERIALLLSACFMHFIQVVTPQSLSWELEWSS